MESTDIEAITNPTPIVAKKRRRNKVFPQNTSTIATEESDVSSEDEVALSAKLPAFNIIETAQVHHSINYENNNNNTDIQENIEIQQEIPMEAINDVEVTDVVTDADGGVVVSNMHLSLATEYQVNELKELIIAQSNLIQEQNTKIDNLTALVTNMSKQLKTLKRHDENNADGSVTTVTRWNFPMKTIDDVKELDESLKNPEDDPVNEFVS